MLEPRLLARQRPGPVRRPSASGLLQWLWAWCLSRSCELTMPARHELPVTSICSSEAVPNYLLWFLRLMLRSFVSGAIAIVLSLAPSFSVHAQSTPCPVVGDARV